jgi:hypothetical protein
MEERELASAERACVQQGKEARDQEGARLTALFHNNSLSWEPIHS